MNIKAIAIKTSESDEIILDLTKYYYEMETDLTKAIKTANTTNLSGGEFVEDINEYMEVFQKFEYTEKYKFNYNDIMIEFSEFGDSFTIDIEEAAIEKALKDQIYIVYDTGERINLENFILSLQMTYNSRKQENAVMRNTDERFTCRGYLHDIEDLPKTMFISLYTYRDNPSKLYLVTIYVAIKMEELE